jgi:hypothetical protein
MAHRDSSEPKTPQEILGSIVTHKKHTLLENNQTPPRIRSLLGQVRNEKNTAEIIAHIVFPESSPEVKDAYKAQSFLK